MKDPILQKLNQKYGPDTRFTPATETVVLGYDLKKTGNRAYGSNVFISTQDSPSYISRNDLCTGKMIQIGDMERFKACELPCLANGKRAEIALYNREGFPISQVLSTASAHSEKLDEGLFTWFAPVEYYGTPWSDNDPGICQVITVAHLRKFGKNFTA